MLDLKQSINQPLTNLHYVFRSPIGQPATAVTAMLTQNPTMSHMDMTRHVSSMDGRYQRVQAGNYQPYPALGNTSAMGPMGSESPTVNNLLHDGRVGAPQPQTVFYPPAREEVPFQRYAAPSTTTTTAMMGPPLQQRQTFAQVTAGRRSANSSALLSRQAQAQTQTQTQAGGASVLNDLDKGHPMGKALNVARGDGVGVGSGSGSASEVMMRDKVLGKLAHARASSLVTSSSSSGPHGLGRQSSRSMDMGLLKWRCRTCTMENSVLELVCSTCSKSRDGPDLQFPVAGESKLMCPSCTFENPPGHMECEVCGNTLPRDIHTYV